MNRMQHILDKADRDGVIRRVRTTADTAPAGETTATLEPETPFATRRVNVPTDTAAAILPGIAVGVPHANRAGLTAHIEYQGPLHAPIAQGAQVAKLVVEGPNMPRQEYPLQAARRIGGANWFAQAWTGLRLTLFGSS